MTNHAQLDIFGDAHQPPEPVRLVDRLCPTCHGAGSIDPKLMVELLERPGKTNGTGTSRRAASTPRKGSQRHSVLRALNLWRDQGMTAHAIASTLNTSPNQIAARLGELRDDGFVTYLRDAESRAIVERETTESNTGMVQIITDAGVAILNTIESRR